MDMEKQLWELWDMRLLQISAFVFPQSSRVHGEEKGFRNGNPLFVKYTITMCKY